MPDENTFNVNTGNGEVQDPPAMDSTQTETTAEPIATEPHEIPVNEVASVSPEAPQVEETPAPEAPQVEEVQQEEAMTPEPPAVEAPQVEEVQQEEAMTPEPPAVEAPIPPTEQPDIDKQLEQNLESATTETTPTTTNESKVKTYIIIAIAGVAILAVLFIGWKIFFSSNTNTDIASTDTNQMELTNSLSKNDSSKQSTSVEAPSNKMEELDQIVKELEVIYTEEDPEIFEEAVIEDTNSTNSTDETEEAGVSR